MQKNVDKGDIFERLRKGETIEAYDQDNITFIFEVNQKITTSDIINIYLKSKNSNDV